MTTGSYREIAAYLPTPAGVMAAHLYLGRHVIRTLVILPPPMEERKASHPALTALSRRLAAEGCAVLRVDPKDSGDAPGGFENFTLAAASATLQEAARALRQLAPGAPQTWLGVRASATLVMRAAGTAEPAARPDALILWEPIAGDDFLRQLQQRRLVNEMVAYGKARLGREAVEAQLAGGQSVDFDGYPLSAALYRELQELRPAPWEGPLLLVTTGPDRRAADACGRLAPAATRVALHLPPFWNTVGRVDTRELEAATAAWLEQHGGQAPTDQAQQAKDAAAAWPAPVPNGTERMVEIPAGAATLRGVLHTAESAPAGRILFLPGWSGDRTGPHRMFVHAARRLSAQGFTCLRIDYRGRGDSDDAAATIASMTADAAAALDWLRTAAPAGGPLLLAAICSGCKVAIGVAAQTPDVARLVLWSPESMGSLRAAATGWRKRLAALRTYGRKLLRPETWRKLLRGQVRSGMVLSALAPSEVRSAEEARAEDRTLAAFRSFRGPILAVFGGSDPDAPGSAAAYERFCAAHGIPLTRHTVPHAGHSYYGRAWEDEVLRTTAAWLDQTAG
jgi:alpha/beta superfamily hydrolase